MCIKDITCRHAHSAQHCDCCPSLCQLYVSGEGDGASSFLTGGCRFVWEGIPYFRHVGYLWYCDCKVQLLHASCRHS